MCGPDVAKALKEASMQTADKRHLQRELAKFDRDTKIAIAKRRGNPKIVDPGQLIRNRKKAKSKEPIRT